MTHAHFSRRARAGAPPKYARSSSAPARDVRVSHESAPASGHDPCPKPKPLRHRTRTPEPVCTGGHARPQRRHATDPVAHRRPSRSARPSICGPPPTQTNCGCEFMQPLPLPIPSSRSRCFTPASSQLPAPSPSKALTLRGPGPFPDQAPFQPAGAAARAKPAHARTGSAGYLLNRGSTRLCSHSQNSLPRGEQIVRAWRQVAHSPTRIRRSASESVKRL
jgi:hypothetical protein